MILTDAELARLEYKEHLGNQLPTVGSDLLADLVVRALVEGRPISVVRMSDGEEKLMRHCHDSQPTSEVKEFSQEWRQRFGVEGIQTGDLLYRLRAAAQTCTFFAPDGGEEFFFRYFVARYPFAEIYFPHRWTRAQRIAILAEAKQVTVVHGDSAVAQRIQNSEHNPHCKVISVLLSHWSQSESVINEVTAIGSPLVFVSGGPASKYIVPAISQLSHAVVLDMGSGAPHFWCTREQHVCGSAKHCGAVAKI